MFGAQSALDGIWIPFSDLNEADQLISVVHHGTMVHLLMQIHWNVFAPSFRHVQRKVCALCRVLMMFHRSFKLHPNCTSKFVLQTAAECCCKTCRRENVN